ncbi:hypothetical protein NDN08_003567 [Rhodosorus marinus]|uniref:Light-harvesting complex protein n=1 Tax=Rhodosorus marinus TaxID=101924 RepID=A0AAV8UWW7_9RHOD|nr:hypothetical protein NDN08_003567 [Rhodosorus marinus]
MLGFVNGVSPLAQRRSGAAVSVRKGVVTMLQSKAMPFMEAPPALDGSMAGDNGFDPLGLTNYFDVKWMQEAEIKHCRICMLACMGFLIPEIFTLPWSYFPKDMLAVDVHDYFVKTGGLAQVNLFVSAWEAIIGIAALQATMEGDRAPGDYGFDPLGLGKDPATMKRNQTVELINGRLAMCAIGGFIHQQWIYKQGIIDQLMHFKPMY